MEFVGVVLLCWYVYGFFGEGLVNEFEEVLLFGDVVFEDVVFGWGF